MLRFQERGVICPAVPLSDYLLACCRKEGPPPGLQLADENSSDYLKALLCVASAIGALEPLSALRPGACDIRTVFDKTVEVAPATLDSKGNLVPTDGKLIKICAPMGLSLVVNVLRGLPANLTAAQSGAVVFKSLAVMGYSESFCPPGEPADGDDLGTFQNIEHVLLRPETGFDLYARNFSTVSSALFTVHAEMWATC